MRNRFICLFFSVYLFYRFGAADYLRGYIPHDFDVYWLAVERFLHHENFYLGSDGSPFKYSAGFLIAFRWTFYLLEKKTAILLWRTLSIGCFFGTLSRLAALTKVKAPLLAGIVILSIHGVFETLAYGQVDLFLGAGLILIATLPKKSLWSSLIIASLLSIKPHFLLIFIPWALWAGASALAQAIVLTLVLYCLPVLQFGVNDYFHQFQLWLACLREQQGIEFITGNMNQSLSAVVTRIFGLTNDVWIFSSIGLIAYCASFFILFKRFKDSRFLWFSFGVLAFLLFSPLSWRWDIFLWIPIALILQFQTSWRRILPWMLLALASQTSVAHLFHYDQKDAVSFYGIYACATIVLFYSTVTDFAKLRGLSMFRPKAFAQP